MENSYPKYFTYEVKSHDLLSSISKFYLELVTLCQKYDPAFPSRITHLSINAEAGKLVDWKVHGVEFARSKGEE